jgi:hypothetical protein
LVDNNTWNLKGTREPSVTIPILYNSKYEMLLKAKSHDREKEPKDRQWLRSMMKRGMGA